LQLQQVQLQQVQLQQALVQLQQVQLQQALVQLQQVQQQRQQLVQLLQQVFRHKRLKQEPTEQQAELNESFFFLNDMNYKLNQLRPTHLRATECAEFYQLSRKKTVKIPVFLSTHGNFLKKLPI
jgi:hypothetical protein